MGNSIKKILSLALTGVIVFSLAGCKNKAVTETTVNSKDEKVVLKLYVDVGDEDTKAPYDYAMAALKTEMPNVEIQLEASSRDDDQKIKTYASTGNLPDIFSTNPNLTETFKKSNNILKLDTYSNDFKKKMIPSNMNTLLDKEGHVYAFPYAGNEYVLMFYNKELFAKNNLTVPTTIEEYEKVVKVFKAKNIVPLSIFGKEKWSCVALYDVFASRKNPAGVMALNDNKAKITDEAYKFAAEEVVKLVKDGLVGKGATNLNYDQAASLFYSGKAAMLLNGQWEIEASTKALGDKVGWMYLPAASAAEVESSKTAFCGGGAPQGFAVSANSKNKDMAAKVAAFMAEKYAECKFTQRANPLVSIKIDKKVEKQFPPMMQELNKVIPSIKTTTGFDWHLSNGKVKAGLEDNAQNLLTGNFSAEDFIKNMERVMETAFE
ncbi:extracellular solute-binding protein [Clostridium bowmanii]|uniref:ABC transporter substrate-binding protein n=1 Tax=Clostridium bowmanii TaxID=132925 RepID=UPI001C0DB8DE|nr:extracellular solute-binding protein [Clostridium bowmanii]MBU3188114.1 extracellular solute-binding protein [Clostridium bowmanii]MCA1072295.1 extracellular solute-binding protein [Clostridium bowmanii]